MLENCKIKVFGLVKFLCAYGIIISKKIPIQMPIETQFGVRDLHVHRSFYILALEMLPE